MSVSNLYFRNLPIAGGTRIFQSATRSSIFGHGGHKNQSGAASVPLCVLVPRHLRETVGLSRCHYLDLADEFRQIQRLERQMGVKADEEGGHNAFSFDINVAGYRPEELKGGTDMEGNSIVVEVDKKEKYGEQTIHSAFHSSATLLMQKRFFCSDQKLVGHRIDVNVIVHRFFSDKFEAMKRCYDLHLSRYEIMDKLKSVFYFVGIVLSIFLSFAGATYLVYLGLHTEMSGMALALHTEMSGMASELKSELAKTEGKIDTIMRDDGNLKSAPAIKQADKK